MSRVNHIQMRGINSIGNFFFLNGVICINNQLIIFSTYVKFILTYDIFAIETIDSGHGVAECFVRFFNAMPTLDGNHDDILEVSGDDINRLILRANKRAHEEYEEFSNENMINLYIEMLVVENHKKIKEKIKKHLRLM